LGSDVVATSLFGLSILLALWLMHGLGAIALGNDRPAEIRRALTAMLVLVVLMAGTRLRAGDHPSKAPAEVAPVAVTTRSCKSLSDEFAGATGGLPTRAGLELRTAGQASRGTQKDLEPLPITFNRTWEMDDDARIDRDC
jgi:hypothetical protein